MSERALGNHRNARAFAGVSLLLFIALQLASNRVERNAFTSEVDMAVTDAAQVSESGLPKPVFNAPGELERPEGYREWVYVGAPLTPTDLNPPAAAFPEFHSVYIQPTTRIGNEPASFARAQSW